MDSWGEWRRHVLIEMEEHSKGLKEINKDLSSMRTESAALMHALRMEVNADLGKLNTTMSGEIAAIKTELAVLKTKAAFFGGFAGVVISIGLELLKRVWK